MSVTEYFYPSSFSQISGATTFKDLENIANESTSNYAVTTSATSQTNILVCEDFNIRVPGNAEISESILEVAYQKTNFDAKKPFDGVLYNGVGYSSDSYEFNNIYTLKDNVTVSTLNIDLNKANRLRFSCMAIAPMHYNDAPISIGGSSSSSSGNYQTKGYVRIIYVRVKITYTLPSYSLSVKRADHHNAIGQDTVFSVNISNLNQTNHKPSVNITIPTGVSYVGSSSNVSIRNNILTWRPNLSSKLLSDSIAPKFTINTTGQKTFNITETYGAPSKSITFEAVEGIDDTDTMEEQYLLDVAPIVITEDSSNLDNVYETAYTSVGDDLEIKIVVDQAILSKLVSITMTGANENVESITPIPKSGFSESGEATLTIHPTNVGLTHLQVQYILNEGSNTTYLGQHYTLQIMPNSLTYPFLNIIELSQEELNRLGNLTNYTVQSYLRINTSEEEVYDWVKNYRIGVFHPIETLEETPTDMEIYSGVEEWSNALTNVNEFESCTCEFTYHEGMPVYIVITGDYMEGNPQDNTIDYTNPCIIETDVFVGFEETGNYPFPINNTFSTTEVSTLNVNAFEAGTPFVLSEFGLDDFGTNENMAITGVMLEFDIEYADELALSAKLKSPNGKIGQRSILIEQNSASQNVVIGGTYDTWGFTVDELVNLEDFEVEVQANNLFNTSSGSSMLQLNNASLTFYFNNIEPAEVIVKIDDIDIRYYNLTLVDAHIPQGLQTITKYIEIDGTDSHDSYRQNIAPKEITLKMRIKGCNVHDTSEMLRKAITLLQPKRDELNNPIPKKITFDNFPDLYWKYIIEDDIDSSFDFTDPNIEVKLKIPKGTAFSKDETVTNTTGAVIGIAKVNPKIVIIPLGDHVEIMETSTEQKFSMNNNSWSSNNLVEIDCNTRQILLKKSEDDLEPEDISSCADFNSDWFILHGDYNFEPTNCIIQSVTYTERW